MRTTTTTTTTTAGRGRIYRRCGCRDIQRRQLGARCPRLITEYDHGTWTFAVDLPTPRSRRTTVRRGGFHDHDTADLALRKFLEGQAGGFNADPNQTLAAYLTTWLKTKALTLKPTTMVRYRAYTTHDLIPALGSLKLDELSHRHIAAFVHTQLAAGRSKITLYRCLATLSSALGDAVRQHRLAHNPAQPSPLPRPPSPERRIWTAAEAVRFLHHCHRADPYMADLFEVLIGTGMRKGEALGLHWSDVHLTQRVPYVRCTLSAIDNNRLVLTSPKTRTSKNWIAISPRVATALQHQARNRLLAECNPDDPFTGLVFCRPDGRPLRPRTVLERLHALSAEADVPRITVHDLRHLAATLTITAGVPLTVVSKTLRHSTLSTTANLYSHLTQQAAHEAVDTIDKTLTDQERPGTLHSWLKRLRPRRDHICRHQDHPKQPHSPTAAPTGPAAPPPRTRKGDHTATTTARKTLKAALASLRKRPPTCANTSRDDRI
ncbi:tyrosine recombinase XerC [Streptomyces sp. NPDC056486]|uniref:site-specific integrase n=1 Tax=Streptomyces sp. NPDC056486 TaxID=3345835 RepID=UPI0036738452